MFFKYKVLIKYFVLVLCSSFGFKSRNQLLWERLAMFQRLAWLSTSKGDVYITIDTYPYARHSIQK